MFDLQRKVNPFSPGAAAGPAHLAGRDRELHDIEMAVDQITEPRDEQTGIMETSARAPVTIVGLRGAGKTTLLGKAREMAEARKLAVVAIAALPDLDPEGPLVKNILAIVDKRRLSRDFLSQLARIKKARMEPTGLALNSDTQHALFEKAFETCLAQQPLALLLDEAMDYDPEALGVLMHVCKAMIGQGYPLALLLAGTPGLNQNLDKAKADFMCLAHDLHLSALSPQDTREALCKPFEERGVKMRDGALELMADMAEGCPQFIQIIGHEVWQVLASTSSDEVDQKIVGRAQAGIQQKREKFYQDILGRIKTAGLIGHAQQVMEVLRISGGRASQVAVLEILERRFEENAHSQAWEVFHEMLDLGFIWSQEHWIKAGVPSLLHFCDNRDMKRETASARRKRKPFS